MAPLLALCQCCCTAIALNAAVATPSTAPAESPLLVQPHPGLGKFHPDRDPDRPILACYGGIGLHDLGNGRWTGYNIQSKAEVDLLMARCRQYGIHRLYASLLEQSPPSRLLAPPPGYVDLIPYAIERAHAAGVQLYADIPAFAVFDRLDTPFLEANPETLTRDEKGEPTRHMFSPAWPKVRAYKRAIILEWLSKYPVDGVQLDFIRWPYFGNDLLHGHCVHGYDEPLLAELRKRHGLPDNWRPASDDPRFFAARRELVTQFIRELREDLRRNGISLPIGVYNSNAYGRLPSMHDVCQDWQTWDAERLVDEHHPMFYFDSLTRLGRAVASLTQIKRADSTVFGPVFLAEGAFADGLPPTPAMCVEAARRSIKLGCAGIWFCRASEIEQFQLWPAVKQISQLSIRSIRAESFDPLYENLVANGEFDAGEEHWKLDPAARIVTDEHGRHLRVELQKNRPVIITQAAARPFCTAPPIAARSLGLSCIYRTDRMEAQGRPQVRLELAYTDSQTITESLDCTGADGEFAKLAKSIRTAWAPPAKTLKSARISIHVPAGSGSLLLDRFELTYDPLDNPLTFSPVGEHK